MSDRSVGPPSPSVVPVPPWPPGVAFPRFSEAEYATRWSAFRALLRESGASVGMVAGNGAGRAEIQFLSNAPVRWESLLVVPADEGMQATLLVQLDNHAAGTAAWSTVPIEVTGPDLAPRAAELARACGTASTPVALLGPISERLGHALRAALPGSAFVSVAAAFQHARKVKSDEELQWTRYGAALCDRALEVFMEEARSGLREDELGAIMTDAVASAGGQLTICFMATASMTAGGAIVPNQTWSRRTTTFDDLVMFELSAGFCGATGQLLRTISLGHDPSPVVRRLHDVAERTYAQLFAAIRPGLRVTELESIGAGIEADGFTIVDDLVHGYGGGYLPPHIRTPATRREDLGDAVLQTGQLLVIQPNIVTPDHRHGVQTGQLVVVTESGATSMHETPQGLLRIGAIGTGA